MEQHEKEELRMIALGHIQLSALTVPFYVVTTLEDCGVKVHAVIGSPIISEKRELLPVTETRAVVVPAELRDVEQAFVRCA